MAFFSNKESISKIPRLSQIGQINNEAIIESSIFNPNTNRNSSNNTNQTSSTQKDYSPSLGVEIDKDKLYETFVLFQSFINMNNNKSNFSSNINSNNNIAINSNSPDNNIKALLQERINQITLISQYNPKVTSHIEERDNKIYNNDNKSKEYDERPIKCTNGNFIELVEKSLANDKPDESGNNKTINKKNLNKAKTNRQSKVMISQTCKTYHKPLYPCNKTEENNSNYQMRSMRKTIDLSLHKNSLYSHDTTSRREKSYIKTDQATKCLRKSNTDVHPYMPLNAMYTKCGKNILSEPKSLSIRNNNNKGNGNSSDINKEKISQFIIQSHKIVDENHQRCRSRNSINKDMNIEEEDNGDNSNNNEDSNYSYSSSSSSFIVKDNNNINEAKMNNSKKEESFHIIEINANETDIKDSDERLNKSEDVFSIDEESNKDDNKSITNSKSDKNTHNPQANNLSFDAEPIQSNDIPVSNKLFNPLLPKVSNETIEMIIQQKQNQLNNEMALFQEERTKVALLKSEYDKLHHRFENQINELTENKKAFAKWREGQLSKLKKEQLNTKHSHTIINDLRKENKILKSNEQTYKADIKQLSIELKSLEKESKEKEYMKQLNLTNIKTMPNLMESIDNYTKRSLNKNNNTSNQSSRLFKPKTIQNESYSSPIINYSLTNPNESKTERSSFKGVLGKRESEQLTKAEKYDFGLPEEYKNKKFEMIKKETTLDGKEIRWYTNNKREIIFPSGTRKELYSSNNDTDYQIIYFNNGDIKQLFNTGKSIYYIKETNTIQTSNANYSNIKGIGNRILHKNK